MSIMTVTLDDLLHHELDEFERARKERGIATPTTNHPYPGLGTTPQAIAQLALDRLGLLLNGDSKRAREGAVALVLAHTYALAHLGEIARGEIRASSEDAEAEDTYEPDGEEAAA